MADATGGLQEAPKERACNTGPGYMEGRAEKTGAREPKERERKLTRGSRNCESVKRGWDTAEGRVLGRAEGAICQTEPGRAENARARSER